MIFNRKKRKNLETGDFCQMTARAMPNKYSKKKMSAPAIAGRIGDSMRSKQMIKTHGIHLSDCALLYVRGKSRFGKGLLEVRPAALNNDRFGIGIIHSLDSSQVFHIEDAALELIVGNPRDIIATKVNREATVMLINSKLALE